MWRHTEPVATWICDTCGATGDLPEGSTSDQINCDTCGEPVLPDDPNPTR
jgi:hypothetical protein